MLKKTAYVALGDNKCVAGAYGVAIGDNHSVLVAVLYALGW
jgi:hypothetical protein